MRRSFDGRWGNSQRVMRRHLQREKISGIHRQRRVACLEGGGGLFAEFTERVGEGNHHHQPARPPGGPSVNSLQPLAASPQTPAPGAGKTKTRAPPHARAASPWRSKKLSSKNTTKEKPENFSSPIDS